MQVSGDLSKLYDKLIKGLARATSNSVHTVSSDELYIIAKTCSPTERSGAVVYGGGEVIKKWCKEHGAVLRYANHHNQE